MNRKRDRRAPDLPATTPPVPPDYQQGRAHVPNAREAERRAAKDAAGAAGTSAREGHTPGGVSS